MGKYGEAAVKATQLMHQHKASSPPDAWRMVMKAIFPSQQASQSKGCPRGTYLGLCEAGIVKGVRPGNYSRARLNKQYALEAVRILSANPALKSEPAELWALVMNGQEKVENSQMDVVIGLWEQGLVNVRKI